MSNDVKLTVGVCVIVVAIFGSAVLVSHVMIELAGVVRADLKAFPVFPRPAGNQRLQHDPVRPGEQIRAETTTRNQKRLAVPLAVRA